MLIAVVAAINLARLERNAGTGEPETEQDPLAAALEAANANVLTCGVLLVAGVLVALGLAAGLYVAVVPVVAALCSGIFSAWLLLATPPHLPAGR